MSLNVAYGIYGMFTIGAEDFYLPLHPSAYVAYSVAGLIYFLLNPVQFLVPHVADHTLYFTCMYFRTHSVVFITDTIGLGTVPGAGI